MDGEVDERPIEEVQAADLKRFDRCHFFAGIAGWDLALQYAGWPPDRPVWTGSCPCQSLSVAGLRKEHDDKRHLWPAFFRLIEQARPSVVFGEQVRGTAGIPWLSAIRLDLAGIGHELRALDIPSAGIGAPHIRNRLYWVADAYGDGRESAEGSAKRELSDFAQDFRRLGSWTGTDRIRDRWGVWRPIKPGIVPMVDGFPGVLGQVRAYGNAINPVLAAAFIVASQGECQ